MGRAISQRPARFLAIGMVLMLVFSIGSAAGAQNSSVKTFYACEQSNGSLSRISAVLQDCGKNQTAVSWNQIGPMGPQGPVGETGPQGPIGPAGAQGIPGASGLTNVYVVQSAPTLVATGDTVYETVRCNPGDKMLGGGFQGAPIEMVPFNSKPIGGTQWEVGVWNFSTTFARSFTVFGVCASVSP